MIRTIVIDDEQEARKVVRNYLDRFGSDIVLVGEADGVRSGKELISLEQPDLVFLDVRMQDGTGFDLLSQLPDCGFRVIFITAFDEYALRAFRFHAIDYLLKPLSPREFREALEKASNILDAPAKLKTFVAQRSKDRRLSLKTLDSIHLVQVDQIVRCQSDNSYTTVHLSDGRSIVVSRPIKEFEEELTEEQFIRTHQSHLVNLFFVERFDRPTLRLQFSDGQSAPVSTRRKDLVLSLFDRMG